MLWIVLALLLLVIGYVVVPKIERRHPRGLPPLDYTKLEIFRESPNESASYSVIGSDEIGTVQTMYHHALGLSGRPDYLIRSQVGIEPVEYKSTKVPNLPYPGHIVQLGAYFLIMEQFQSVAQGRLLYTGGGFIIRNNAYLREYIISLLKDMHGVQSTRRPYTKPSAIKCRSCIFRKQCPSKTN